MPPQPTHALVHERPWILDAGATDVLVTYPVIPGSEQDSFRVRQAQELRRLMTDSWRGLLRAWILHHLGPERGPLVGAPDTSENVAAYCARQISTLYDRAPSVPHPDEEGNARFLEHLDRAGRWSQAQRLQVWTNGMRDCLLRFFWRGRWGLGCEVVPPDAVYIEPDACDPGRPALIRQAVWRMVPNMNGRGVSPEWTIDEWDIRDPGWPRFRVLRYGADPEGEVTPDEDLTRYYTQPEGPAQWWGKRYPYRLPDGYPVLPFALYHAAPHGGLWSPVENSGLVTATLRQGLLWTLLGHSLRTSSWTQRWATNVRLPGAKPQDPEDHAGNAPRTLPLDSSSIALLDRLRSDEPVQTGEWSTPIDIEGWLAAVRATSQAVAVHFDLSPADLEGSDVQSGRALVVRRSGQRRVEARQIPLFRPVDDESYHTCAAILWAHGVRDIPREGWGKTIYGVTELTPEERAEMLDVLGKEMDLHLTDRVGAYARLNQVGEDEAEEALARMDARAASAAQDAPVALEPTQASLEEQQPASEAQGVSSNGEEPEVRPEAREFLVGDKTTTKEIVQAVGRGDIPPDSAQEILVTLVGLTPNEARRILRPLRDRPSAPETLEPESDAAITTTTNANLLSAERIRPPKDDEDDGPEKLLHGRPALASDRQEATEDPSPYARAIVEALRRLPVPAEVVYNAEIPEGINGLCDYAAAEIRLGEMSARQELVTLAHEAGHWTAHHLFAGEQPEEAQIREEAAYRLGWQILDRVGAQGSVVSEEAYRGQHVPELADAAPKPVPEAEAWLELFHPPGDPDAPPPAREDEPEEEPPPDGQESYTAPEGAQGNAAKVLRWREEHGDAVKGMTRVGWTRANQLAKGEPLSRETVGRMANFARHRQNAEVAPEFKDEPWRDAGYVAWLGWGGTTGIRWAQEIVARDGLESPTLERVLLSLAVPPGMQALWSEALSAVQELNPDLEPESTPHVTVLYLGEVAEADMDAVRDVAGMVCAQTPVLSLQCQGLDTFPPSESSEGRVPVFLDFGAEGPLGALHHRLSRILSRLGSAEPFPEFRAHMTLGYAPEGVPLPEDGPYAGARLDVPALHLTVGGEEAGAFPLRAADEAPVSDEVEE